MQYLDVFMSKPCAFSDVQPYLPAIKNTVAFMAKMQTLVHTAGQAAGQSTVRSSFLVVSYHGVRITALVSAEPPMFARGMHAADYLLFPVPEPPGV